ncbi:MAG: enoyl-CoA hydratase/isomerase family protein, partial [Reyranella sp.]|nr:enoyl-CoA hydratase/isomerase family protein [Reyranella sp.]
MKDRVSIDLRDGVADVRLIRADKMNALDPAMFEGIIEAGAQLAGMKGLRCVVLSGEGKAFCAGLDMASFAAMNLALIHISEPTRIGMISYAGVCLEKKK